MSPTPCDDGPLAERLRSQQLVDAHVRTPRDVVANLVGVQAQDRDGALWSVGLRLPGSTRAAVERALADRQIVHTWAMRGTLHLVAADDVRWLLATLAPGIVTGNARRYRELGLGDDVFPAIRGVIGRALQGGRQLTRAELCAAIEAEGVSTKGQRAPYLLQRAALGGLICHGGLRDHEPTYALLEEWIPDSGAAERVADFAELSRRYMLGHGPATAQDFAWWCGVTLRGARRALDAEEARSTLPDAAQVDAAEPPRTAKAGGQAAAQAEPVAQLLPRFDEWLLGYRDRVAALDVADGTEVSKGGGVPRPTVAVNGRVIGVWSRRPRGVGVEATVRYFREPSDEEAGLVRVAADRLAAFLETDVTLKGA